MIIIYYRFQRCTAFATDMKLGNLIIIIKKNHIVVTETRLSVSAIPDDKSCVHSPLLGRAPIDKLLPSCIDRPYCERYTGCHS